MRHDRQLEPHAIVAESEHAGRARIAVRPRDAVAVHERLPGAADDRPDASPGAVARRAERTCGAARTPHAAAVLEHLPVSADHRPHALAVAIAHLTGPARAARPRHTAAILEHLARPADHRPHAVAVAIAHLARRARAGWPHAVAVAVAHLAGRAGRRRRRHVLHALPVLHMHAVAALAVRQPHGPGLADRAAGAARAAVADRLLSARTAHACAVDLAGQAARPAGERRIAGWAGRRRRRWRGWRRRRRRRRTRAVRLHRLPDRTALARRIRHVVQRRGGGVARDRRTQLLARAVGPELHSLLLASGLLR